MAKNPRDLKRLADELADLTPEERERVLADVRARQAVRPLPKDFRPPVLKASAGRWVGGDLRREGLYDGEGELPRRSRPQRRLDELARRRANELESYQGAAAETGPKETEQRLRESLAKVRAERARKRGRR